MVAGSSPGRVGSIGTPCSVLVSGKRVPDYEARPAPAERGGGDGIPFRDVWRFLTERRGASIVWRPDRTVFEMLNDRMTSR
jgi:hypothetical protein